MRRLPASLIVAVLAAAVAVPTLGGLSDHPAEAGIFHPDAHGDRPSPFYHSAPAELGEPGSLLRSEAVRNPGNALGINNVGPYRGTRVLYTSTARDGRRIPVSGIVVWSKAPWTGPGPRPVVAFAPGTQGMSDECAPSKAMADGAGMMEQPLAEGLLKRGYALAVTDYEGLGTPGAHTYMDRLSQGHALLDVARVATHVPGTGASPQSPVALAGYSQGGGASAAAAELAASYAPELQVKAASVGASPADLTKVASSLDKGQYFAFEGYALRGLGASYRVDVDAELNDDGRTVLRRITNSCTGDLGLWSYRTLSTYTKDGKGVAELLSREPYRTMLADQRIGRTAPAMPVLITHARGDDVIPFAIGEQLRKDWCTRGAHVTFRPGKARSHVGGVFEHAPQQERFIVDAFAGRSTPGNCA